MWAQIIAPGSNVFDKLCDALCSFSYSILFSVFFFLSLSISLFVSACLPKWQAQLAGCQFPVLAWQQSSQLLLHLSSAWVSEGRSFSQP